MDISPSHRADTRTDPLAQRVAQLLDQRIRFSLSNTLDHEVSVEYVPAGRGFRGPGSGCFLLRGGSGAASLDVFDLPIEAAKGIIDAVGASAVSQALDRQGLPNHLFSPPPGQG